MTTPVNPNLIKASNLILIGQVFGIVNGLLFTPLDSPRAIITAIIVVVSLVGIALLIRRGSQAAKWVFLIVTILGIVPMFFSLLVIFSQSLVSGTIAVINCVLQILAIIFMFTPSKQVEIDCNQSE